MSKSRLDEIRGRYEQRPNFRVSDCSQSVQDVGYLLWLVDAQQAKLDACCQLVQSWERNAAKIGFPGMTAVMVCVSEMKAVLSED